MGVDARIPPEQMPEHERATFYNNLFDHVVRRSPRAASGAWIHAFNNYVRDWSDRDSCVGAGMGFGPSATGQAQLVLENNVLQAWDTPGSCKQAVDISDYVSQVGDRQDRGRGLVRASNNMALNGAVANDNGGQVFNPRQYYSYTLLPPDQVAAIVEKTAGVRAR
jgi:pectate lyase